MTEENTKIKIECNDRSYVLECSPLSPLGELYDVLSQMKSYVLTRMKEENEKNILNDDVKEVENG